MSFHIQLSDGGPRVACAVGQTALAALASANAREVSVGCRSGGCGVCRVQVLDGEYDCGLMSRAQISERDREQGIVLACQLIPRSDLQLRPLGRACRDADFFQRLLPKAAA
jgi:ferredoxin